VHGQERFTEENVASCGDWNRLARALCSCFLNRPTVPLRVEIKLVVEISEPLEHQGSARRATIPQSLEKTVGVTVCARTQVWAFRIYRKTPMMLSHFSKESKGGA